MSKTVDEMTDAERQAYRLGWFHGAVQVAQEIDAWDARFRHGPQPSRAMQAARWAYRRSSKIAHEVAERVEVR